MLKVDKIFQLNHSILNENFIEVEWFFIMIFKQFTFINQNYFLKIRILFFNGYDLMWIIIISIL